MWLPGCESRRKPIWPGKLVRRASALHSRHADRAKAWHGIPLTENIFDPTHIFNVQRSASSPKCILVVDDDRAVLAFMVGALQKLGFRTLSAETPEQALAVASDYQSVIDLLLVDAVMPHISGPELADRLVSSRRNMRVMFCTGVEPFAACLAFGKTCDWIKKPFTSAMLVAKVRKALQSRQHY
jgi:two-component system, cell cycle sensor histidine kinase and response regulator CckA